MITVLTTTYDCAPYIDLAIKSILIQTYSNFELLIIDDGSTDNTEEVVKNINDKRIRYIKRKHFGRSASLNFGLRNASNEIIALMDADDISDPRRLETQLKYYSNKIDEIIFTSAAYFSNNKISFTGDLNISREKFYLNLALHGPYNNSTALFNKHHILRFDGFDESLSQSEDHEFWLRVKDKCIFTTVPEILYFFRLRKSSLSHNHFLKTKHITYNILEKYYKNIADNFKLKTDDAEYKLRGWREFFYGSPRLMCVMWRKLKLNSWDFRMMIAIIVSFLPTKIINYIKRNRIRFRLQYFIQRRVNADGTQKKFEKVLKLIN